MNDVSRRTTGDMAMRAKVHEPGALAHRRLRVSNVWRRTLRGMRRSGRIVVQTSVDKCRLAVRAADDQVHASPWPFIGLAALCAAAIGFISGRRRSSLAK